MSEPSRSSDEPLGVLICDDVASVRRLLRLVIDRHEGSRPLRVVGEARDGNEAVSEADRLKPDVVLLDLSMPNRTGLDALPDIKRVAPHAKVIVLSSFATEMVAAEILARGADRYLEKGAEPRTIIGTIEEVVDRVDATSSPRLVTQRVEAPSSLL